MINDSAEILAFLTYIRSQNRMVSVVSTFKGVSFSLTVNIISIMSKENAITVSTQQRQNMSLLPNTQVTIHSDLFPHAVQALVSAVDNQRKSAVLSRFAYQRSLDENRTHVRVLTRKSVPVLIWCENDKQFNAQIHDISIEGVSIIFPELTSEIEEAFQTGKSSRLRFELELADTPTAHIFNIPAKIAYSNQVNGGQYRVGMQTFPTPGDQSLLRRYIFDMQTEMFRGISSTDVLT